MANSEVYTRMNAYDFKNVSDACIDGINAFIKSAELNHFVSYSLENLKPYILTLEKQNISFFEVAFGREAMRKMFTDENGNYLCTGCTNCRNCKLCVGCTDCTDCKLCTNCTDCKYINNKKQTQFNT